MEAPAILRAIGKSPPGERALTFKEPLDGREKKLAAVRAAAQHAYPTADIDQMLDEISSGYQVAEPQ